MSASLSASVVAMRTASARRAPRSSVRRSRARRTSTSSRQLCVRSYRRSRADSACVSAGSSSRRARQASMAPRGSSSTVSHSSPRRPRSSRRASGVFLQLHLDAQDVAELPVVARRGEDALQRAARREGDGGVVRRQLQDLPVHGLGPRHVVELALVEARDVGQDLGARQGRDRRCGRRGEDPRRPLVGVEAPRDLQQALARPRVVGIQGEQAREGVEGPRVIAQALVAKLGHPAKESPPFVHAGRELQVDLQDAHQIRHLVARCVHCLEDHRRARAELRHVEDLLHQLPGLASGGTLAQHLLEVGERRRRVPDAREEQRPQALLEVEPVVADRGLQPSLEQLRQAVPLLLGGVEGIERANGVIVHRLELEDALVIADGAQAVAGDLLGDQRDLGEELGLARGLGRRADDALVEGGQIAPLLARGEDLLQALEGALVARLARQHALEVGARALHVAQLLVEQASPRARPGRAPLPPAGRSPLRAGRPPRWRRRRPARVRSSRTARPGGPTGRARWRTRRPRAPPRRRPPRDLPAWSRRRRPGGRRAPCGRRARRSWR